jgi:hypothetical protein
MVEDREKLLQHYRAMHAAMHGAIDGLTDKEMSDPSIDGWSVKDHLGHLSAWDEIRAREVERVSAGHASTWHMSREQAAAFGRLTHELRRNLSAAQLRWELDSTHERLLEAIAAASERALDGSLYGEAGLFSTHEVEHTEWIARWRQRLKA